MHHQALLLLITGLWLIEAKNCELPKQDEQAYYKCLKDNKVIPCSLSIMPGTIVKLQCEDFYDVEKFYGDVVKCMPNGRWNQSVPSCVPVCGKLSSAVPLIVKGKDIAAGVFPWHAALYNKEGNKWEFWCGGSLVSTKLVLTAAHCTWQVKANELQVALGKKYREKIVEGEKNYQLIQVDTIRMLGSYQDIVGNYNDDLAILVLAKPATITAGIAPICIDWHVAFLDKQLRQGNTGVVLGWGLTENYTFPDELRAIRMPVASDENCIKQEKSDFLKYIKYTSFCAGYVNGSGVCNGDSGGGLAFLEPTTNTWYLQGVVSLSPRRKGTQWCDPSYYTMFTKVSVYLNWLRTMKELSVMVD